MSEESKKTNSLNADKPRDFRETLGTMDEKGKRIWVYPKKPHGKYYTRRGIVSIFLLIILFGIPIWNYFRIKNGMNPFFEFNVIDRQFYIFGKYFQPQDFPLLALGAIITLIFISVFTVIWGRLFCGWICPQTIFLEMVFRKIEYLIDGDRNKQMKLSRQAWDNEKIFKRTLKYSIYAALSIIISFFFLSYIVGSDVVMKLFEEGISKNIDTFIGVFIFAGLFFFVFSWFREQACTLVCPYGRLQAVLIDKQTVSVAYDFKRGEGTNGRSKWKKGEDRKAEGKGDCIDCNQCVVVCPTGIDIRNGANQLECINCTACIDACNEVMEKIDFPPNLIKYASEDNIENGTKFKVSGRAWAYSFVIVLLLVVFNYFLLNRSLVQNTYLRVPGSDFIETDSTYINPYQYILTNRTDDTLNISIELIEPKGFIDTYGKSNKIVLPPKQVIKGNIRVIIPIEEYHNNQKIKLATQNEKGQILSTFKTTFRGPVSTL